VPVWGWWTSSQLWASVAGAGTEPGVGVVGTGCQFWVGVAGADTLLWAGVVGVATQPELWPGAGAVSGGAASGKELGVGVAGASTQLQL